MLRPVERQDWIRQQAPDGVRIDLGVTDENFLVDLVEKIVRGVPPPASTGALAIAAAEHGCGCVCIGPGGLLAHIAVDGRHTDAPEGLVARAGHAPVAELLLGLLGDGLRRQRPQLGSSGRIGNDDVALAAGGIDIDVDQGALLELFPVFVGIPAGAGVASLRVAGPEHDAEAPLPVLAVLGADAPDLHHGGVGAAIVHDAIVPGVVVTGEEHERLVGVGRVCRHLCHQDRRLAPAGIHVGVDRDGEVAVGRELRANGRATVLGRAHHNGFWQVADRLLGRAAPDRGDAHLVGVLVGADMQLPHGACFCCAARDHGAGHAIDDDDLAPHVLAGELGCRTRTDIDELRGQATSGGRLGERVRDAPVVAGRGDDRGFLGQADIRVMQDEAGGKAIGLHPGLDVLEALEFLRNARFLAPLRKLDHVLHHQRAVDGADEGAGDDALHSEVSLFCSMASGRALLRMIRLRMPTMMIANRISRLDSAAIVGSCHFCR